MSDAVDASKKKSRGKKMDLGTFLGGAPEPGLGGSTDWADDTVDDRERDSRDRDRDRDRDYDRRGGGDGRDRDYDRRGGDRDRDYDRRGGDRDRDRDYDRRGDRDRRDYDRRDRDRDYDRRGDRDRDSGRRDRDRDGGERRERRGPAEIPDKPPYTAYIGNLPYELTQDEVLKHFFTLKPVSVRLVRDRENDRPKGFGYIEFEKREQLVEALSMDGSEFKGRDLRVNLAETRTDDRPKGFAGGYEPDVMDWRTAKAPEIQRRERSDRDRDYDRRDRDRGDRDRDYDRRDRDRGGRDYGRGGRRGDGDDAAERFGLGGRSERPRLNLKPRTAEPGGSAGSSPAGSPSSASARKSNPFGAARPRDENEILKKKEEERKARLAREKEAKGGDASDDGAAKKAPAAADAKDKEEKKLANKFDALKVDDEE